MLDHFPDIKCPMICILKEMSETREDTCEAVGSAVEDEHVAQLERLLRPHQKAYHDLEAVQKDSKILVKKKCHENGLEHAVAEYYVRNVKCENSFRLSAATKGQSRNLRFVTSIVLFVEIFTLFSNFL